MNDYEGALIFDEGNNDDNENVSSDFLGDLLDNDNDNSATVLSDIDNDDRYNSLHHDHSIWSSLQSLFQKDMEEQHNIPKYDPPSFLTGPSSVTASYKLQVKLNKLFDRNKVSL